MRKQKRCTTTKSYNKKKKKALETLAYYKNEDGSHKESSIEKKVREFLTKTGVFFKQEFSISHTMHKTGKKVYKVYDFYVNLGTYQFLIELDGSYFHAQDYMEGKMPKSKLTKLQKDNIKNDKLKNQIAKEIGVPLLRFWEDEVKWDFEHVKDKILEEMSKGC